MKILVTGATGFIGGHLVEQLIADNHTVYCICRETSNTKRLESLSGSENLKFVNYDLCSDSRSCKGSTSLNDILKDVDYVYHLAGLVKAYTEEDYVKGNFQGTKLLLEAIVRSGNKKLRRFLHLSSLAAVGPAQDIGGIDEQARCKPISYYGRSKRLAELIVNAYKDRIPITIVRPPPVYGPGDTGLLFFFQSLSYRIKPQLNSRKYVSLVYVQDLVRAIIAASESEKAVGETYFVADKSPYSINAIVDIISKTLKRDRSEYTIRLGDKLISGFAGLYEDLCKFVNKSPSIINRQKALELRQNYWICQTNKIKLDLDYETSIPIQEGIRLTADWYLSNGWLS